VIIDACKAIRPSWRDELEITDAIQWLIEQDYRVDATFVEGWWRIRESQRIVLEANRLILDDLQAKNEGQVDDSKVMGRVIIEKGTKIEGSVIKGPCIIRKR